MSLTDKPTEEMVQAGFDALEARGFHVSGSDMSADDLRAVFIAMDAKRPVLTDTQAIGIIIEANIRSRQTRVGGTTNWAGDIWNALKRGVQ
ncbi:hypothetical protein D3C85_756920 [compost metagenome]